MYSSSEKFAERQISRMRALAALDLDASFGEPRGDLVGDQADAVLVGVKQVATVNLDAADHDRRAEIDQADVGMADTRVQAKELEAEGLDLVEVARAAAGDMPDTTELLMDRRGDLSELGTQPGRLVQVPADRDLGAGHRGDVAQIVAQQVDLGFGQLGLGGPGSRVTA